MSARRITRATALARGVRKALLSFDETPRDLTGACGLAAMLIAVALGDARTLRTGFYLKCETFFGKRGSFPHRHAWNCVGSMIIDVTATQFDRRNRSIHVIARNEDPRYLETASAGDAIDDILVNWRGNELPGYVQLAKQLRYKMLRKQEPCAQPTPQTDQGCNLPVDYAKIIGSIAKELAE
jgi:hypothetical protein